MRCQEQCASPRIVFADLKGQKRVTRETVAVAAWQLVAALENSDVSTGSLLGRLNVIGKVAHGQAGLLRDDQQGQRELEIQIRL